LVVGARPAIVVAIVDPLGALVDIRAIVPTVARVALLGQRTEAALARAGKVTLQVDAVCVRVAVVGRSGGQCLRDGTLVDVGAEGAVARGERAVTCRSERPVARSGARAAVARGLPRDRSHLPDQVGAGGERAAQIGPVGALVDIDTRYAIAIEAGRACTAEGARVVGAVVVVEAVGRACRALVDLNACRRGARVARAAHAFPTNQVRQRYGARGAVGREGAGARGARAGALAARLRAGAGDGVVHIRAHCQAGALVKEWRPGGARQAFGRATSGAGRAVRAACLAHAVRVRVEGWWARLHAARAALVWRR